MCARSRASGFTLVELLVVIAIIAVLASVLMGAANYAIKAAQRAKAFNLASQIQSSCTNYYTEYSLYPVPSDYAPPTPAVDYYLSDAAASAATWKKILFGLCGNINPYDGTTAALAGAVSNNRAIPFLSLKSSDVNAAGGPYNQLNPNGAANPYFNIVIDLDYDNIIGDTGPGSTHVPNFSTSTVAAGMQYYPALAGPPGGVAVWANCNGTTSTVNPAFYVRTY